MIFLDKTPEDACLNCGRRAQPNINISFTGRNEDLIITFCRDCAETAGEMIEDHFSYGEEDEE